MRPSTWFRIFGCLLASHALLAQVNSSQDDDDDDKRVPTVELRISPQIRGDLNLTIYAWETPAIALDKVRQSALTCDWRLSRKSAHSLDGVCRKYFASDGASAHGSLALTPLVVALRNGGASYVHVILSSYAGPLAKAPEGWHAIPESNGISGRTFKSASYDFWSLSDAHLPAPLEIRIGTPWSSSRLMIPLCFTLFVPALIALWLRRRAERKGTVEAASVWVHWILTGMWLYWISALSLPDIAAFANRLQFDSVLVNLLIGAALYSAVPLTAVALCVAILMRHGSETGLSPETRGLVLRSVAREAVLMIPLGIFLVGMGMFQQDWHVGMLSLPAAFFVFKILNFWVSRRIFGGMEILSRGPIRQIAGVLAGRAGISLGGLYIIGNHSVREANAFAWGGRMLALTRGLVEHLTCRELIAVIGHEIGHMRRKHVAIRVVAFWAYFLVIGPAAALGFGSFHVPSWVVSLPFVPLVYIFATSFLSRKHEFSADAQAVELVGDPEGMIAALARLRTITRSPVDWGGIQGSILSHPSMRDRVLAIARKFNVPEERALAILHDPDLLSAGTPADELHFALPTECTSPDLVFTSRWRQAYVLWAHWAGYLVLAGFTILAAHFVLQAWPRQIRIGIACAVPVVAALYLTAMAWSDRLALKFIRARLKRRMPQCAAGTFVGLLPGSRVGHMDGFPLWDAGFLFLASDHLTYCGERTTFSIPRAEVTGISIGKGPLAWDRDYAVVVSCGAAGAFTLSTPDRGCTWFSASRLKRRLSSWSNGEPCAPSASVPLSPPPEAAILHSRCSSLRGWQAARHFGLRALMLCIGFTMVMPFDLVPSMPAIAFLPLVAPLAYLLAYAPLLFRPKPEESWSRPAVPVQAATPAVPGQSSTPASICPKL